MSNIYQPEYKILVDCLKEYRVNANMSQQELAKRLGTSQAYISKYEQCQKRLDVIEIRNICNCLGVTLSEFISNFEERIILGGIR